MRKPDKVTFKFGLLEIVFIAIAALGIYAMSGCAGDKNVTQSQTISPPHGHFGDHSTVDTVVVTLINADTIFIGHYVADTLVRVDTMIFVKKCKKKHCDD